jgi:hypothetical protein
MIYLAIRLNSDLVDFPNFLNNEGVHKDDIMTADTAPTLRNMIISRIQFYPTEQWMTFKADQVGMVKQVDLPPVKFDPVT